MFHTDTVVGGYAEFESRAAADFPALISLIGRYAGTEKSLLDVGCGRGFFLEAARTAEFEVKGIDLSDTAAAYARGTLKIPVRCGMLGEQQDWSNMFDVVVLLSTIEHLPDPLQTLTHINRCLHSGGILLLVTGLAGDVCDLASPGSTQWYDAPQHLWVFSRKGLLHILRETGFEMVHCDTCFEHSMFRRYIRKTRNLVASLAGAAFWLSLLGPRAYKRLSTTAQSHRAKKHGVRRNLNCDKHLQPTSTTNLCVVSGVAPANRNSLRRLRLRTWRPKNFAL